MAISEDAAAIVAANPTQAHATYTVARNNHPVLRPEQLVEQVTWAYRRYLDMAHGRISHEDAPPA
jgi:hypothetical protein